MPAASARSIARLDGAETAQMIADPGQPRLLHDLERRPAADHEHRVAERQPILEQHPADHLVHRVVPADVLGERHGGRRR